MNGKWRIVVISNGRLEELDYEGDFGNIDQYLRNRYFGEGPYVVSVERQPDKV